MNWIYLIVVVVVVGYGVRLYLKHQQVEKERLGKKLEQKQMQDEAAKRGTHSDVPASSATDRAAFVATKEMTEAPRDEYISPGKVRQYLADQEPSIPFTGIFTPTNSIDPLAVATRIIPSHYQAVLAIQGQGTQVAEEIDVGRPVDWDAIQSVPRKFRPKGNPEIIDLGLTPPTKEDMDATMDGLAKYFGMDKPVDDLQLVTFCSPERRVLASADVAHLDPFSESLTDDEKTAILRECKNNAAYYMTIVAHSPNTFNASPTFVDILPYAKYNAAELKLNDALDETAAQEDTKEIVVNLEEVVKSMSPEKAQQVSDILLNRLAEAYPIELDRRKAKALDYKWVNAEGELVTLFYFSPEKATTRSIEMPFLHYYQSDLPENKKQLRAEAKRFVWEISEEGETVWRYKYGSDELTSLRWGAEDYLVFDAFGDIVDIVDDLEENGYKPIVV